MDVLNWHNTVFDCALGTLKGYQAKIHVDPQANPRFCKAQTVPYAMQAKVEEELLCLQEEGIIELVDCSDLAAPIVTVLKSDRKSVLRF